MKLAGLTLNLVSMLGLIIVLGLLVDDAIIVSEHVYSKVEQGMEPKLAAIAGAEAVTWPVVCAIITTIVAFVPLMFIEGQIGDWMGVLPVIVCISLTVSLFEALTILPSHLAHGLRPLAGKGLDSAADGPSPNSRPGALRRFAHRVRETQHLYIQQKLLANYERLLRKATAYRYVTMAALTALLIMIFGVILGDHVPFVFLQKIDSETIVAELKMEVGTPIDATRQAAGVLEQAAMDLPELKTVYTLLGLSISPDGMIAPPQAHLAQLFIELTTSEERDRSSDEILRDLRAQTSDLPGAQYLKWETLQGGPGGAPIHLDISGEKLDDLVAVAREIQAGLSGFAGVYDIVDDFNAGQREVQIELFDSATALGLTTQSLATQVRSAFYGFEARKVQRGREDVKIMVRYPPEDRRRIYDVELMRIATPDGSLVPFTEVARLTEGTGFGLIKRINQRRTVTVTADVDTAQTQPERIIADLRSTFPDLLRRYPGVELAFGGQKLETSQSFGSLKQSFVIAVLLIYVILAGLFRSYVQPIIVLSVVPFGLIGAVVAHYFMGYPLTILSMIGIVALTGIVVNDSMILVTFINRMVADGMPAQEAVIEGGKGRLRAILLTSVTTVLGVAPLMMEQSFQAKFMIPMAVSISGGLVFATVLTLVAVPSLYLIMLDGKDLFHRFGMWAIGRTYTEPETAGAPGS